MPIRTCVACRSRAEKRELLRWVASDTGEVQVDPRGRVPGRGRYVCRKDECLERLLRMRMRWKIDFAKAEKAFRLAVRGEVPQNVAGETHGN